MNYFSKEGNRRFWHGRFMLIPVAIVAGVAVFGFVVMYLWNSVLSVVLGIHTITFLQALGILVLSKILFGGFHGGHRRHPFHRHSPELREKWRQASPEEREKMRAEWWSKFGNHARPE
jgi:Ca2+/H+ antiporter, TMEM165/GDT1 family